MSASAIRSGPAIPLSAAWLGEAEAARVAEAMRGRTAGDGPIGRRVERRLAERFEGRRVLLTTSCTHALELALLALGIGPGQEVICPSFTFVSTANAILRVGARPVFAEIEDRTLGLDTADVARRITDRTAALLPVHYAGVAPDMEGLLALAEARGLRVIEDAAQGLGSTWRERPLGALGDVGCLSFHETKNITCGEGGALVVRDPELAARAEIVREKGTNRSAFLRGEVDKYTWVAEGSSYILSDVLAAILDAQLDRFDEIQSRRARVSARYRLGLADWARAGGVRLSEELPERTSNHHIFYLLFPGRGEPRSPARITSGPGGARHLPLRAPSLLALRPHPLRRRGARRSPTGWPATLLRLPLHPLLTDDDVDRVVESVLAFAA